MRSSKWSWFLTIVFLAATYEHLYKTLGLFSANLVWLGINWSIITNALLVLGIDLTTFFGVRSIANLKRNSYPVRHLILLISVMTIISIMLNVKYMLDVSPSPFGWNFETVIAVTVGAMIPFTIIIFAWHDGVLATYQPKPIESVVEKIDEDKLSRIEKKLRDKFLKDKIQQLIRENPNISQREIAEKFGITQSKVSRLLNGNGQKMDV